MQSIGKSLKSAYKICDIDYTDKNVEDLDRIMIKVNFDRHEKADRGSYQHNYHRPYGKILGPERMKVENILEVGIWVGLGLLAWARYFPNSRVEGIDKSFQWERKIKRLFTQEESHRIRLNWCDTTNLEMVRRHIDPQRYNKYFDIIVDDGNHFSSGQKATLINLWDYLKPGGWYFVEDITDKFELPDRLLEYMNRLGEEGHEVGWFEYPSEMKTELDRDQFTEHDSNLVAIRKKYLTKEEKK